MTLNIAQLFTHENLANLGEKKAARNDALFPVEKAPFTSVMPDGTVVGDKKRCIIYRTDTNAIVGIHGADYKLVTNAEVFGAFEEAIERSRLDTTDMIITDQTCELGGMVQRVYRFPGHVAEPKVGDITEMQLLLRNSYNGGWSMGWDFQGNRLACTNGMVLADGISSSRRKHTSGLDIATQIKKLNSAIEVFANSTKDWSRWVDKQVTDEEAMSVFRHLNPSERFKADIELYWMRHKEEMGSTLWALYNTMTWWSSHQKVRPSSQDNLPAIVQDREAKVLSAMRTKDFQLLAA